MEKNIDVSNALKLAQMADCYALHGKNREAKLLFREAFYVNAQKIDLSLLDSDLIKNLAERVVQKGFSGKALLEWIPVYGQIYNVFNIKRRLQPAEVVRLKRRIYNTEAKLKKELCSKEIFIPRLIKFYFRLIDYYISTTRDKEKVRQVLTKIKMIDGEVYREYVS